MTTKLLLPVPPSRPFPAIRYRPSGDHYRVWRTDWPGDTFEIITIDPLNQILEVCQRLAITVTIDQD